MTNQFSNKSGDHPSLHPNCHHQIIFTKFNLRVPYPPPYYHQVWHYEEADIELIRQEINLLDWKILENSSVDEVSAFSKTDLNTIQNFILHEILLVDDKDHTWISNKIKNLINEKNTVSKHFCRNSNNLQLLNKLESLQNLLMKSIMVSKGLSSPPIKC